MHHFHINQQDEINARFFDTLLSFLEFHLKFAKFSWLIQSFFQSEEKAKYLSSYVLSPATL